MSVFADAAILAQKYRKTRVLILPSASLSATANATTNFDASNFRNGGTYPFVLTHVYAENTAASVNLSDLRLRIADQEGYNLTGPSPMWASASQDLSDADRAIIPIPGGHEVPATAGFTVEVTNTSSTAGTVRVVLIGFNIIERGSWIEDIAHLLTRVVDLLTAAVTGKR